MPGRILAWTPNAHSVNVCLASCVYAAERSLASCVYAAERLDRSIEKKALWDPAVFLKRPDGPIRVGRRHTFYRAHDLLTSTYSNFAVTSCHS
jgi:hypothetical protein